MKTKSLSEVKIEDEAEGRVTAVFATLNVVDSDGDVTRPGAFKDNGPVRISQFNHASWGPGALPIGTGTIKEVGEEAIFDGKFFMNMQVGRDTFEAVKELGALGEWSYGFDVVESAQGQHEDRDVQFLDRLKVHEVSPVILGAGVNTRTLAVKNAQTEDELREALKEFDLEEIFKALISDELKLVKHGEHARAFVRLYIDRLAEVSTRRAQEGKGLGADASAEAEGLLADTERIREVLTIEPPTQIDPRWNQAQFNLASAAELLAKGRA